MSKKKIKEKLLGGVSRYIQTKYLLKSKRAEKETLCKRKKDRTRTQRERENARRRRNFQVRQCELNPQAEASSK